MADTLDTLQDTLRGMIRAHGIHRLSDFQPKTDATALASAGSNAAYWQDTRAYYTGYRSGVMFAWDQYFEAVLQWHAGFPATWARNGLCLFLESITPDGFVPRTVPKMWWSLFQAQPFFCQLALLICRWETSSDWLFPEHYFRLKQYLVHWLRRLDPRGAGLSVWDHAGHTGMDNQYERAGHFHDAYCEGVDLNCYLIRELQALALLSQRGQALGLIPDESAELLQLAEARKIALNRWCWNATEGFLFDFHAYQQRPIPVRHAGVFAALWAEALSTEQATSLVEQHLRNPDEFARAHPIPALAMSEPGYHPGWLPGESLNCCSWRAHTWLPVNYFTFQGLRRYGFSADAKQLADQTQAMFIANPFREYYLSETGVGMGREQFLGWSALALYMNQELELATDPTALSNAPLPAVAPG